MLDYVFRFFGWVFKKFAGGVLIVALLVVTFGVWLFLRDGDGTTQWKMEVERSRSIDQKRIKTALADVIQRRDIISKEMIAEQERGKQADKIIEQLRDLESTWNKFTDNAAQQKANAARIESLIALRAAATAKIASLQQEFNRATWARDGLELQLSKLTETIEVAKEEESPFMAHVERTWNYELGWRGFTQPVSWWTMVALIAYFVGPGVCRIFIYYFVAPGIVGRRPVRLSRGEERMPSTSDAFPSLALELKAGQRLWVKEKFLRQADGTLRRTSRPLLDWSMPLTCYATGLKKLVELQANETAQLTLSNPGGGDAGALAVVALEEGASLVLRPSFLAGAVTAEGKPLKIRRRWQLFRWQSWVMWQFRHLEFTGPATLIVASPSGLRLERLAESQEGRKGARQVIHEATVGFTPGLAYSAVRTNSFLGYLTGANSLFDDRFSGEGLFVYEHATAGAKRRRSRHFFSAMWSRATRVFGL